ncbi:hypothetical protein DFH29DRAFT_883111 [Suillus ampliporus]|nr:hypothetical protein DFH29DRAFT_883111 [Suillus ampliporus]
MQVHQKGVWPDDEFARSIREGWNGWLSSMLEDQMEKLTTSTQEQFGRKSVHAALFHPMEPPSSPSSIITAPPDYCEDARRPADGEGKKIPPSDLEEHQKEYDFRYPCCLCTDSGGREVYVEAAVYSWWNGTTKMSHCTTRCASNTCRYQVKIDTYFQIAPLAAFQYLRRVIGPKEQKTAPIQLRWTLQEQTELLNKLSSSVDDGITVGEFQSLFKRCKKCMQVGVSPKTERLVSNIVSKRLQIIVSNSNVATRDVSNFGPGENCNGQESSRTLSTIANEEPCRPLCIIPIFCFSVLHVCEYGVQSPLQKDLASADAYSCPRFPDVKSQILMESTCLFNGTSQLFEASAAHLQTELNVLSFLLKDRVYTGDLWELVGERTIEAKQETMLRHHQNLCTFGSKGKKHVILEHLVMEERKK